MKNLIKKLSEMKTFLLLWSTQSFSALGSQMTSYALVLWSYSQKGSALMTALLMVSSYAPYVLFSIFAGALSDRWDKKKTMLVCDLFAAMTTVLALALFCTGQLKIWHLYLLNGINGLMNTVQQPASEVAITRILPKQYYQKVGGIRYFSNALNSILTPVIATAVMGLVGIHAVFAFDLITFGVAFLTLAFAIRIPHNLAQSAQKESVICAAKQGVLYLNKERGIMYLLLFLAAINLVASMYNAAMPAMILSRAGGGQKILGIANATVGISTLLGSIMASLIKKPKSRVRVICNSLLFSMSFENFMLAFGRTPLIWCVGEFVGWIAIPLMSTNLEAILRLHIPEQIQGRVYAVRNSLQFFTIPVGYFIGGLAVDQVFEPIMRKQEKGSILVHLFGSGKGSGAAFLYAIIAVAGIVVCLYFRNKKEIWDLER